MDRQARERFMEKVSPEPNTGCWLWSLGTDNKGYGRFGSGSLKTMRFAHRLSYELFVGPIPDGMFICHKCDVRSCVNPDHLFVGTHKDNMADRDKKNRQARGSRQHLSKLTEDLVRYIRASSKSSAELSLEVGVNASSVCAARARRTWRHVE